MSEAAQPESTTGASPIPRSVFPEYERVATELIWTTLNELMSSKDPVLAQIPKVEVDELPASPVESTPGTLGVFRPLKGAITFVHSADAMLRVDVGEWAAMVDDSSKRALDVLMPQFFAALDATCNAAGQTVDAKGQPFSADLVLDMFEKLAIDFDESGAPELPTMVVGPELFKRISKMPPLTPAQEARFAAIIEAKRREHDAKRRVRKLDKDPR